MIMSRPDLSAIKRGLVQLPEFTAYLSDPDLVATVFLPNTYVRVASMSFGLRDAVFFWGGIRL
jgi:hypothetical protein